MKDKLNPENLNDKGLNLQSVFNIDQLPLDMLSILEKSVSNLSQFNQLIVIGHGGTKLWNSMDQNDFECTDPIDDFPLKVLQYFLKMNRKLKE